MLEKIKNRLLDQINTIEEKIHTEKVLRQNSTDPRYKQICYEEILRLRGKTEGLKLAITNIDEGLKEAADQWVNINDS